MTHEPSVSDSSFSPSDNPTETYRVEAHNRSDHPDVTDRRRFDFRLTRTEERSMAGSTVADLLAAYLGVAGYRLDTAVQSPTRVTTVSVEGTSRLRNDHEAGSTLVSLEATVQVETTLSPDALETWRTAVRDDRATQQTIPTGVPFSLHVTRAP